jgi:hypothetical protein
MRKFIEIFFLCLTVLFCRAQKSTEKFEIDDDGITVEKFDSTDIDDNRYNKNNSIYKVSRKFIFSYYYQDTLGVKFLMTKGNLNKQSIYEWTFEKLENKNPNSVSQIILTVKSGLSPFIQQLPDYNQTIISYYFKQLNGEYWTSNEMTGVIENIKNLWMHPPRTDFFKILEINPFPYIKAPFEIGNKWTWKLKIGSFWGDKRWIAWKGIVENVYNYEIIDKIMLQTKLGNIECWVISSKAESKIGETKLKSYFNNQFGFVKLDYTNIDGSKTIIELEKME